MKYQMNKIKILRCAVGFLALGAGVWLASEAMAYREFSQQVEISENNSALTAKLAEAAQLNLLLCQVQSGKLDEAKVNLNYRLFDTLEDIKTLTPAAQPSAQLTGKVLVSMLEHSRKLHPEYYLAIMPQPGMNPNALVEVAQH